MKPAAFLLVSPGPVDGYPPVQYQARILADMGYPVTLVTMSLKPDQVETAFSHPGVTVHCSPSQGPRSRRMMRFASALWAARRKLPRETVEIAFDPIGLLYSDLVLQRPPRRVAHLHELLQDMHRFTERRLKHAIRRYDAVVVADAARASLTQSALAMSEPPLVIENYPLRAAGRLPSRSKSHFEVIYCGSLGLNQKLDAVIRSIPYWPGNANFVLIGNNSTHTARKLQALAENMGLTERVQFLGWMDTPDAERRLSYADLGITLLDSGFEQWRTALGASNKRYQYMKAGLPQIGDTNPGVPELLDGIGACVDATTHDPVEIAALVATYAANPARSAEEGARAFARHQDTYNYEQVFQRLLQRIASW